MRLLQQLLMHQWQHLTPFFLLLLPISSRLALEGHRQRRQTLEARLQDLKRPKLSLLLRPLQHPRLCCRPPWEWLCKTMCLSLVFPLSSLAAS